MNNYPPGVTGNEWQIAGPTVEQEKQGFIEDWVAELKKMEDRLYEIAKEVDAEIGNDDFRDNLFTDLFGSLSNLRIQLDYEWDQLEGPDEYDDPRL